MVLKNDIKKVFEDKNKILLERYRASKLLFVFTSLLFFLNFYFIGANYNSNIFIITLGYTYIIFIISLLIYLYFLLKKIFIGKEKNIFLNVVIFLFIILFIFLIFPIIIKGGLTTFINLISSWLGIDINNIENINFNFGSLLDSIKNIF